MPWRRGEGDKLGPGTIRCVLQVERSCGLERVDSRRLGLGLEAHQVEGFGQLRLEEMTSVLRQHCENVEETESRDQSEWSNNTFIYSSSMDSELTWFPVHVREQAH